MSKKLQVHSGDILAVPTIKNEVSGYILARVIRNIQDIILIEFFDKFYDEFNINRENLENLVFQKSDRLFPPIKVILLFDDNKGLDKWKILANSKTLDIVEASKGCVSLMYSYQNDGRYLEEDIEKKDPPEARNRIAENEMFWQVNQVLFRIRFYMDNFLTKGEIFPLGIYTDYYKNRKEELVYLFKENFENSKLVSEKITFI